MTLTKGFDMWAKEVEFREDAEGSSLGDSDDGNVRVSKRNEDH